MYIYVTISSIIYSSGYPTHCCFDSYPAVYWKRFFLFQFHSWFKQKSNLMKNMFTTTI